MAHLVLQLVPVLSMLFLLTSAAGASLLAADVERELQSGQDNRPNQDNVDAPPPYEDDPI